MSKIFIAEMIGTFILVLFGCGAAVLMGEHIGMMGIAFAFGLAIVAAAYGIGPISGANLNPAVSLGAFVAGRIPGSTLATHVAAQLVGAVLGAAVLYLIASGKAGYDIATNGLGQNGYGAGYLGEYSLTSALVFEAIATFLFVTVILGATASNGGAGALAGLAIGLTLVVIHLAGINVSGSSVNPARSLAPAIFLGGDALAQMWLYIIAPLAGGAVAGVLHAAGITRAG